MGHTLVTRFAPESRKFLSDLMGPFDANKIPFGRNCDRESANNALDYHMTVFHWDKTRDSYYLERLRELPSLTCRLSVTGTRVIPAEEGSWLLCFRVVPGAGFDDMLGCLEEKIQTSIYLTPHITLMVSKDRQEVELIEQLIRDTVFFPLELNVEGLDLYHIWVPTEKVRTY